MDNKNKIMVMFVGGGGGGGGGGGSLHLRHTCKKFLLNSIGNSLINLPRGAI